MNNFVTAHQENHVQAIQAKSLNLQPALQKCSAVIAPELEALMKIYGAVSGLMSALHRGFGLWHHIR